MLSAIILSRIQFAFVISFHIIFPALTIGLASWLVVLKLFSWRQGSNQHIYQELYKMWVKVFALTFGMGVVSGVVMSYQFGTNWAGFSLKAGNIIGPLMSFEVLTAFFLEASFLGIMLFGEHRVGKRMHFFATLMVAIGTLISAFWILSVNSWMHTPAGFSIDPHGTLLPESWWQIIFNPSFPYRFVHMVLAAYLSTAFMVAGTAGYYFLRQKYLDHAKIMLLMAISMAVIVTPIQVIVGHAHGVNTLQHQPAKIAAIEGIWETETAAPLTLFAWPDSKTESNHFAIKIPKLASKVLTGDWNAEILGLKHWPAELRPPVLIPFFGFRIMVGLGVLMLGFGIWAVYLWLRQQLFSNSWFFKAAIAMGPSGLIALLAGWFTTEVGRQPYVIYGLLTTAEASSNVPANQVLISLIAFITVYSLVFGCGIYYFFKLLKKGPVTLYV